MKPSVSYFKIAVVVAILISVCFQIMSHKVSLLNEEPLNTIYNSDPLSSFSTHAGEAEITQKDVLVNIESKDLIERPRKRLDLARKSKEYLNQIEHLKEKGKAAQQSFKDGEFKDYLYEKQLIEKIFYSAKEGNWPEFVNNVSELEVTDKGMLDMALIQAIYRRAPFDIIFELINRGADLNKGALFVLASSNRVKLTKKLVELGLNLHLVNEQGNAINSTIETSAKAMFEYLLANDLDIVIPQKGLDALDQALGKVAMFNTDLYFVSKLLEAGHPIFPSHREQASNIQKKWPNTYNKLIELSANFSS